MLKRTDKLLIGKDISRDAEVIAGAGLKTISASTGMADGEVVVLDKFKKVLAAGSTVSDTDSIFICQGTSETFNYTNESGTLTSTNRKLIFSDRIEGKGVRSFKGVSYSAKSEASASIDLTGMTPVVGTEYIIRLVFKDVPEHPGQFQQTYRVICESATLDTFGAALAAKVNAHSGRRVDATYTDNTDVLLLTAKEIPDCTTSINDIDKFKLVDFEMFVLQVDSDGNWETINGGITSDTITKTDPDYGSGNWEQIRDLEKAQLSHIGITNRTQFPVVKPDIQTVLDETYDLIVIEHDRSYLAPNVQGNEEAPLTAVIAIANNAAGPASNQAGDILAQLNPWMASCPGAFSNISV